MKDEKHLLSIINNIMMIIVVIILLGIAVFTVVSAYEKILEVL